MFGWRGTRRRKVVAERVTMEDGAVLDDPRSEPFPAPDPRSCYRVIHGPHDNYFRVEKIFGYGCGASWLPAIGARSYTSQEEAEAWIEREVAGPKVVKVFP